MTVLMFSDLAAHASALAWVDAKRAHLMGNKAQYEALTEKARRLENAAVASRCRAAGVVPVRSQTSFAMDGDCA